MRHRLRVPVVDPSIAAFLAGKATITDDEFARDFFGRDWERPARGVRTSLAKILTLANYQRASIERGGKLIEGWSLRPAPVEPEPATTPKRRVNAHRERRINPDAWDGPVTALLSARDEITSSEVFQALRLPSHGRAEELRLAGVMWRAGWESRVRWDPAIKRSLRVWAKKPQPVEKTAPPS